MEAGRGEGGSCLVAFWAHTGFPAIPGSSEMRGTSLFSPLSHSEASSAATGAFVSGKMSA